MRVANAQRRIAGLVLAIARLSFAQTNAEPGELTLTFPEVVERALTRHPSTLQARAEVTRAWAIVEQVRAGMLPSLSLNAVGTQLDGARGQGATVIQAATSFNANLQLSVPLLVPQRWNATSQARQAVEVAQSGQGVTAREVAYVAAQAYLTAVLQNRLLETARRARDTARTHYDFAHQRLVHGVGNRLDEARAEKELHDDEARVASSASSMARAEEALGVVVAAEGRVHARSDVQLPPAPGVSDALVGAGGRADVALATQRAKLADRLVADAWLDFLPSLSLQAQSFVQTPPTLIAPSAGWQAQLLATVSLYDGSLRYGLHREREALKQSARAALEQQARQARSEVRSALDQLAEAERAQKEAELSGTVAAEVLSLANTAYRAGASTNLEVIDAERNARDAEASVSVARDVTNQVLLNLLIASGAFPAPR